MQRKDLLLKKIFFAATILFFSLLFASCNYGLPIFLYAETGVEERAVASIPLWGPQIPQVGTNGKYSFIVLTDSHFGSNKGRNEEAFLQTFKALLQSSDESLRPRFIVNLGDTLDGGHSNEADMFNLTAARWIAAGNEALGISDYKVYSILGNHDLYNNGWEIWKTRIFPFTSCYRFTLNAGGNFPFDFFFLDTGNGTLGGPQIEDLERNLQASWRPKIILMHYPVYAGGLFYFAIDDTEERARLISAFAKNNVKYVFEGHMHRQHDFDFGPFKESDVGSYLEEKVFGLVTVDETTGGVSFTRMHY